MKFIQIARRVLAYNLENYSLIDVVNGVLEMEEFSISTSERAEMKLSYSLSKMYENFDVTKITDTNEELIEFFRIYVAKPKIDTLMTIGEIDYDSGIINHIKA